MNTPLDDYLAPIGKVTIAAALLEEVVLRWAALLSEDDVHEVHYKNLTRGLEANLGLLISRVTERVSPVSQQQVLDLIENARTLKNKRNESVHGVWGDMVHSDTGEFAYVARSRYEKDKSKRSLEWDLSVPTIAELEALASELKRVAHALNNRLSDLWDIDEDVQRWRSKHGY